MRAGLHRGDLGGRRLLDLADQVGGEDRRGVAETRARFLEGSMRVAGPLAGTAFDDDLGAGLREPADAVGDERDAKFVRRAFCGDAYQHERGSEGRGGQGGDDARTPRIDARGEANVPGPDTSGKTDPSTVDLCKLGARRVGNSKCL